MLWNPEVYRMDLATLVGAVEVLMAPGDWPGREAWLTEGLARVR